jgi:hypothetical protein
MGISRGLGTLVTHGHLGAGGLGEAPDVYDFEPKTPRRLLSLKGNNFLVSSRLRYRSCMCRKSHTETILHLRQTIPKIRSPHGIIQWGISHVARLVCRNHWYAKRLESFAESGAHEGA